MNLAAPALVRAHDRPEVISLRITSRSYLQFTHDILELARRRTSAYVCFANVHMVVEAARSPSFAHVVNSADLVAPDGVPVARAMDWLYGTRQERVAGMDMMGDVLAGAARQRLSVYFYGSSPTVLQAVVQRVRLQHPNLLVAGSCSPPFRTLTPTEEAAQVEAINQSGARLVLVALGCPKQEVWMHRMRGRVGAVMLGVGGAFPVYAGLTSRAPRWMQQNGLEWLFRLLQEPRRLLKRYVVTNTLFVWYLLGAKFRTRSSTPHLSHR